MNSQDPEKIVPGQLPPPVPRPAHSHQLTSFPVIALILLHYATFGIFSLIWLNLMHGRLPRVRSDDPSAGRAIGFCFIPFFNFYWIFFVCRRLCLRIAEQRELYGLPPNKLTGLATTACIFQVIPYINILLGYTIFWPVYIGMMQSSVNQLVKQSATTAPRTTLQPLPPAPGMPGWAIALIVCGCASPFILGLLATLLLPALAAAKFKAQEINCINNEKQLALAVMIYSGDHDNHLPPAATWCDAIQTSVGSAKVFKCPAVADAASRCDYAFNARLGGLDLKSVDPQTVMIFESDTGWNASGGPEIFPDRLRHQKFFIVAFADGSVHPETSAELGTLRWNP